MSSTLNPLLSQIPEALGDLVFKNYQSLPIKPIDIVQVLYDFGRDDPNIITLQQNEIIYVMSKSTSGWWDGIVFRDGSTRSPARGWFPKSFTRSTQWLQYIEQRLSNQQTISTVAANNDAENSSLFGQQLSKESLASSASDIKTSKDTSDMKNTFSDTSATTSDFSSLTQPASGHKTQLDYVSFVDNATQTNESDLDHQHYYHNHAQSNPHTYSTLLNNNLTNAVSGLTSSNSSSKILSPRDAEKLVLQKFGHEPMIYWLPQLGPEGKTLYYNADLDVYCNELPFSSGAADMDLSIPASPLVASGPDSTGTGSQLGALSTGSTGSSSASIFNSDDFSSRPFSSSNYADVVSTNSTSVGSNKRGQKFMNFFKGLPKKPHDDKLSGLSHTHTVNNNNNKYASVRRTGTTSSNPKSNHQNPNRVIYAKKYQDDAHDSGSVDSSKSHDRPVSLAANHHHSTALFSLKHGNNSESNLKYSREPSATATSHESLSQKPYNNFSKGTSAKNNANDSGDPGLTSYDNVDSFSVSSAKEVSQNIYELSDLFIKHPKDLTTWDGFRDTLFNLLDRSVRALIGNDQQGFNAIINMALKICILLHMMARLSHDRLIKYGFEVPIKKRLAKISRSVAQILVNGNLYLNLKELEEPFDAASALNNESELNSVDDDYDIEAIDEFYVRPHNNADIDSGPRKGKLMSTGDLVNTDSDLKDKSDKTSSRSYLEVVKIEIKVLERHANGCYKVFAKLAEVSGQQQLKIPQVYPRFLTGFFSGGNWQNPFFSNYTISNNNIQDAVADHSSNNSEWTKEQLATELKRKELAIKDFQQRCKKLVKLSSDNLKVLTIRVKSLFDILDEILSYLAIDVSSLQNNNAVIEKRNFNIISSVYKTLASATIIMDVLESFDFSIFNSQIFDKEDGRLIASSGNTSYNILFGKNDNEPGPTDPNDVSHATSGKERGIMSIAYPILFEFFEVKQELHNSLSELVMDSQSLTAQDPSIFKSIQAPSAERSRSSVNKKLTIDDLANDLKELLMLTDNIDVFDNASQDILNNFDKNTKKSIEKIKTNLSILLIIIGQLIEEKESLVRYAERVMQGTSAGNSDYGRYLDDRKLDVSGTGYLIDDEKIAKNYNKDKKKKKNAEEVPWYLDSDDEYDLYYDARGEIKGGTKEVLIIHLTNHEHYDPGFNKIFLSTFRSMMTPGELINFLIDRFNIPPPEGLSFEEFQIWSKKKFHPIRLRCVNIMKMLLQKYWIDVYSEDKESLEVWLRFAENLVKEKFPSLKIIYDEVKAKLSGTTITRRGASGVGTSISFSMVPPPMDPAPEVILPVPSGKHLRLLDISPVEFARQLTIRDFELYAQITLLQCLERVWKNKYGSFGGSKHFTDFINNSNKLTSYVSHMVLRKHDINKRASVIDYFIAVAEQCFKINNFSSMTAIISSLSSSPILRLHKTWALISDTAKATLGKMNALMETKRNFSSYRELMKHVQGIPCIPFVGVYLTDLTFIVNGTPDCLNNDPKVINFYKRAKMESIISNILGFQSISYPFKPVEIIQKFIDKGFKEYHPSEDAQFKISLILEPRESASSQWKNINALRAAKLSAKTASVNPEVSQPPGTAHSSASLATGSSIDTKNMMDSASSRYKPSLPELKEFLNSGISISNEEMKKLMDYFDEESSDDTDNDQNEDTDESKSRPSSSATRPSSKGEDMGKIQNKSLDTNVDPKAQG